MTKNPPSGLAASGPADEPDPDQITKEHNDDDERDDITVDPSEDVTVEATEDVTTEAVSRTPHPTIRAGGTPGPTLTPGQRAPTLIGVPIQSLPLPGVTAASATGEELTREINYDDEITVLANPAPADPLAKLDAKFDALDELDALDRPSITDDDEEETKVEPAEAAMKAAETTDDVTTALSAQASLEREKALRRSAPASSPSDDLEFADPEADEEEESLDDELDDGDEVISAGGAVEEEEDVDDQDDGENDGVATATFMKPLDSTGLSGLLNPRRPPSGFGQARLPTPYTPPPSQAPAPATSPFASRLGPVPAGSPYARPTGTSMPAIQVPPPSGRATTETKPGFFSRPVNTNSGIVMGTCFLCVLAGFVVRGFFNGKSAPPGPTVIVAKPTAAPVPAAPVVEPVTNTAPPAAVEAKAVAPVEVKPVAPVVTPPAEKPTPENGQNPEEGLWKQPVAKKPAAPKPHKPAPVEATGDEPVAKSKPVVSPSTKPATPKPAIAATPKSDAPAPAPKPKAAPAAKPAKKAAKVWVDPFAN
jgi:hypothetical protein